VILAGDSLATLNSRLELNVEKEIDCVHCKEHVRVSDIYSNARAVTTCPNCSGSVEVPIDKPPPINTASSTLSFAQKVFPFLDDYGVAVFGLSALGPKTIFNHLKGFERKLRAERELAQSQEDIEASAKTKGVQVVAARIHSFCNEVFNQAFPQAERSGLPQTVFGLQVVGYDTDDSPVAKTVEMSFGQTTQLNVHEGLGITASGDTRLALGMFDTCKRLQMEPMVSALSLQDAIDYADFTVRMTAGVQRFANMIPTVGGDVDIALITSYSEFRWIKSKALARVLEPRYVPSFAP
jgi:hypothetical protein